MGRSFAILCMCGLPGSSLFVPCMSLCLFSGGARIILLQQPRPRQPDASIRRLDIGWGVSDIRTQCIGQKDCSSFGLGLGAAMNLNRYFALDANVNVTPGFSNAATNVEGGRASEFLLGARAEMRARNYGFFLKAQPWALIWNHVITQAFFPTSSTITFAYGHRTQFITNVGAGFEYSPSARIHVRVEVSDLVTPHLNSSWPNNLQPSAGVYVGLGKAIMWKPPTYDPKNAHPFLGTSNVLLIYGNALSQALTQSPRSASSVTAFRRAIRLQDPWRSTVGAGRSVSRY
jgi:hypothetical protein